MPPRAALPPRVAEWRDLGAERNFRGRRIHVFEQAGERPLVVMLHGFPSSSYDFRHVIGLLGDRAVLAFDFLGFGLSDKPRDHVYGLGWQADLTEALVEVAASQASVYLVAHDMGTSVATELMARALRSGRRMDVDGALLFNGSILLERSRPTPAQRMLRSRLGPVAARLSIKPVFRHQFGSVFSAAHPLTEEELDDQWALVAHRGGHRLGHRLVHYMAERERFRERWHGAFRDWTGALRLLWGLRDPVATVDVLEGLRELRPGVPVVELPDVGHYPPLEAPERVADAIRSGIDDLVRRPA